MLPRWGILHAAVWGRLMGAGNPPMYYCANCDALYQIVMAEAAPETGFREITCRDCGAPFPAREGKFVLKYFMLRKAVHRQRWGVRKVSRRNTAT
jgi:hypothetical protein